MNNSQKVSIIVPVYNVEKYLEKCLNSLINQDYKNVEIILVDDGSTDTSGEICDKFEKIDSRIKVIHKENNGVSSARNTGLKSANGDYICFVDADDYIMKDYVEYLYELLINNNADISLTTEMFGNFNTKQTKKIVQNIISGEDASEKILCYKIPIGVYCKLFKKSFIDQNNISFFEDIFMGEGFNFNMLAFQNANTVSVGNKKIYYYRRDNSTSATTKFSIKKCENSLYAMEKMKKNLIIKTNRIIKSWEYAKWRTYTDAYDYMVLGDGKEENKEKYLEYKDYVTRFYKIYKKVNISTKDKIRAMIMGKNPEIIPLLLKIRRKKHNIKIEGIQK